jgi:hypothetical protein
VHSRLMNASMFACILSTHEHGDEKGHVRQPQQDGRNDDLIHAGH